MRPTVRLLAVVVAVLLTGDVARAQTNAPAGPADDSVWSFTAAAYTYILAESGDYVQPTVTANRGRLHLEARYNYEDLNTGSAWLGVNFGAGKTVEWELTPMFGGVFGETTGVAPGLKGSLSWRWLELYSENEYVIDASDSADSFFYNWSELTLAPRDWWRFGLVTQRTRAYQSEREIERGPLVGFSVRRMTFTAYVFNPDDEQPRFVIAAEWAF